MARVSHEEYIEKVEERSPGAYTILDEYRGTKERLRAIHISCGTEMNKTAQEYYYDRCKVCADNLPSNGIAKTHEMFVEEVDEAGNGEYTVLGTYVNNETHVRMRHDVCGNEYDVAPRNFTYGKRCAECRVKENAEAARKDHEYFLGRLGSKLEEEFEIVGQYEGYAIKMPVLHKKCGRIFEISPAHLMEGKRCSHCRASSGEREIQYWLESFGIDYVREYRDAEHPLVDTLRFDFAILGADGEVVSLIEYQGLQHYEPVEFFGGQKQLEKQQRHDGRKVEYAKEMQIPLLVIRYDQDVSEELNKLIPR